MMAGESAKVLHAAEQAIRATWLKARESGCVCQPHATWAVLAVIDEETGEPRGEGTIAVTLAHDTWCPMAPWRMQ